MTKSHVSSKFRINSRAFARSLLPTLMPNRAPHISPRLQARLHAAMEELRASSAIRHSCAPACSRTSALWRSRRRRLTMSVVQAVSKTKSTSGPRSTSTSCTRITSKHRNVERMRSSGSRTCARSYTSSRRSSRGDRSALSWSSTSMRRSSSSVWKFKTRLISASEKKSLER